MGVLVCRLSLPRTKRSSNQLVPATLTWGSQSLTIGAFIDSGADDNFIDEGFTQQAGIDLDPVETPLVAYALDGHTQGNP